MPKMNLVVALMIVAGLIIVALAAYIFTHISGLNFGQTIVLLVIGVVGLFIIMLVLFLLMRGMNAKK